MLTHYGSADRLTAVVLAAGMSSRMGTPKPLLPLRGRTLLQWSIAGLQQIIAPEQIVVVTGHQREQIEASLSPNRVKTIFNPEYETGGMLSSVQAGVRAVAGQCDAAFIALGDQPMIRSQSLQELCDTFLAVSPLIAMPVYQNRRGHPLLVSSEGFDAILKLRGGETLKSFVQANLHRSLTVEVDDPAVLHDVDTPADYQKLIQTESGSDPCSLAVVS